MLSALLCCLGIALAVARRDETVESLAALLQRDPANAAAWRGLEDHREPGKALRVVREILRQSADSPLGWLAMWRLADRVGDYALGAQVGRRAVDVCEEKGVLRSAEERERDLTMKYLREGLLLAERQAAVRNRALRTRKGLSTVYLDARIERIDLEMKQRVHPDPARLKATISKARESSDWAMEHRALVDFAYHCWASGAYREGYDAYRRIHEIDREKSVSEEQKVNDRNGAARLALELALTCAEPERGELLKQALGWATESIEQHAERHVGGTVDLIRDHCVMAHICEALGQDDRARTHYEQELKLVSEVRANASIEGDRALRIFHGKVDHIFEDFALFLGRGSGGRGADLTRALEISEIGRVGALKELFRLRDLPSPSWMDRDLALAELRRRAASSKTAILVYWAGSRDAAVVAITAKEIACFPLGRLSRLDRAAAEFTRVVFDLGSSDAAIERAGREAFDLLMQPALPALAGIERLLLVGAGRWGQLPFAALVLDGKEPIEKRYLAARFELAFAPTLGSLLADRKAIGKGPAIALGFDGSAAFDPELASHFGLEHLPPLRRAEPEAKAVAEKLKGRAFTGREATEETLRRAAEGASLVHIAGHAIVDDEDSSRCAIVLSPSPPGGDGLLTLGEMLELKLSARLVLLSGCRTGRGETFRGEGVGSLARCLLAAGARNLLLSLAPVDDAKAPIFVGHLTEALASGHSPISALAFAQRRMLASRSNAHPAFWAAFVLHGQEDLLQR